MAASRVTGSLLANMSDKGLNPEIRKHGVQGGLSSLLYGRIFPLPVGPFMMFPGDFSLNQVDRMVFPDIETQMSITRRGRDHP